MSHLVGSRISVDDLLTMTLKNRPFLQEQGQVVTRGFVAGFRIEDEAWWLDLRDVEVLDKWAGTWKPDEDDHYAGPLEFSSFRRCTLAGSPQTDCGVRIGCHGIHIHIGNAKPDPWQDNVWPELDTEFLTDDMKRGWPT